MKQLLAVTLLLLSFVSAALADGPFLPPTGHYKPAKPGVVQLAKSRGFRPSGACQRSTERRGLAEFLSKAGGRCDKLLPAIEPPLAVASRRGFWHCCSS